jgi:hypothetical protein
VIGFADYRVWNVRFTQNLLKTIDQDGSIKSDSQILLAADKLNLSGGGTFRNGTQGEVVLIMPAHKEFPHFFRKGFR